MSPVPVWRFKRQHDQKCLHWPWIFFFIVRPRFPKHLLLYTYTGRLWGKLRCPGMNANQPFSVPAFWKRFTFSSVLWALLVPVNVSSRSTRKLFAWSAWKTSIYFVRLQTLSRARLIRQQLSCDVAPTIKLWGVQSECGGCLSHDRSFKSWLGTSLRFVRKYKLPLVLLWMFPRAVEPEPEQFWIVPDGAKKF